MSPTQRRRWDGGIRPQVLRLVLAFVLICAALVSSAALRPAAAAWLDDKHEEMCRSHRGVQLYWQPMRITSSPATCTTDCYGYQLICGDGTKTPLTSQYPPGVSELTIFFHENEGLGFLVKLLMFAPVGFFAFVSTYGSKESFDRFALQNAIIAGLFGVTLLVWGAGDMGEGEWSLARPLDYIVGSVMTFAVVPVFLIVSVPAFLRGWNYLFVAHPAAPLVRPAVRGQSVNVEGLADVLAEGAHDSGDAATYHYQHQAEKARALAAQLNTDSAIAEARAERERRRAELAEAERFLKETRRRSEDTR
jgi:hypothetical protein